MRRPLLALFLIASIVPASFGRGLLVPEDAKLQPLAMVNQSSFDCRASS